MDSTIQVAIGIVICCWGVYLLIYGYKLFFLRQKVLIFPVRWIIWIGRLLFGEAASDKYKAKQLQPKTLILDGISNLVIGMITFVLGTWFVIEAMKK